MFESERGAVKVKLASASERVRRSPLVLGILSLVMVVEVFVLLAVSGRADRSFGDLQSLTVMVALVFTGWCALQVWQTGPTQTHLAFRMRHTRLPFRLRHARRPPKVQ